MRAVAAFLAGNLPNVTATVGIVSMGLGSWIAFGVGYALLTFGALTWLTTILGLLLSARASRTED